MCRREVCQSCSALDLRICSKCSICSSRTSEIELALFEGIKVGEGVVYQVHRETHAAVCSSDCARGNREIAVVGQKESEFSSWGRLLATLRWLGELCDDVTDILEIDLPGARTILRLRPRGGQKYGHDFAAPED